MRQTSKDGKTWFEETKNGVAIGLTKTTLAELAECWHLMPASQRVVIKEGQPLLSVETNEGLSSIPSPVTGIITFFDNKAMNMPDHLDEETPVCTVTPQDQVKKAAAKKIEEELNPFRAPELVGNFVDEANRIREQMRAQAREMQIQQEMARNQPPARPIGGAEAVRRQNMMFINQVNWGDEPPVARAPQPEGVARAIPALRRQRGR